uniref:Uncharacterized protein n=1 Tax=Glossina palpalis gambiensis TaxID=67801 RepID=A0A1B0BBU7_9MUSC
MSETKNIKPAGGLGNFENRKFMQFSYFIICHHHYHPIPSTKRVPLSNIKQEGKSKLYNARSINVTITILFLSKILAVVFLRFNRLNG